MTSFLRTQPRARSRQTPDPEYTKNRLLIERAQGGDQEAWHLLIETNERLIRAVVERILGPRRDNEDDRQDLMQIGRITLVHAIEEFDLSRGTQFSTYAIWWLYQSIARGRDELAYPVHLPPLKVSWLARVKKAQLRLEAEKGQALPIQMVIRACQTEEERAHLKKRLERQLKRAATLEELTLAYQAEEDAQIRLWCIQQAVSIDHPTQLSDEITLGDLLQDESEDVEGTAVSYVSVMVELEPYLAVLTPRERTIIKMRYGLKPFYADMTLEAIAKHYKVSRERIRQIEAKAFQKMQHLREQRDEPTK